MIMTAYAIFAVVLVVLALRQHGREQRHRQQVWSARQEWALTPRPIRSVRSVL